MFNDLLFATKFSLSIFSSSEKPSILNVSSKYSVMCNFNSLVL